VHYHGGDAGDKTSGHGAPFGHGGSYLWPADPYRDFSGDTHFFGDARVRTIGVVTVARSDYGIFQPLLRRLEADPGLRLVLFVGGMHLSPEFGLTVQSIQDDGFEIAAKVEMLLSSDTPEGVAKSIGLGVIGFAQAYSQRPPDILVVLGDRFEMMAAALAALPFKIPVAHLHGGEVTRGAMDEALRHSITKLSHLHFVATEEYAQRVAQLGEEAWRITVSGAPSLDNLGAFPLLSPEELKVRFGLQFDRKPLLVTFHPVTLEYEKTPWHLTELLAALEEANMPVVFTIPNADAGGRGIMQQLNSFVATHLNAQLVDNLGTEGYFSLMTIASAMVGNSSSGIIEAASFKLPVVNIGSRQEGRTRAGNVIDVGYERTEILRGIKRAVSETFRETLRNLVNPYGCGQASDCIVERLREIELNQDLVMKRFHDMSSAIPAKGAG
jgi:UDP-N-acetylglucosamine 2-epimerase (non-hydrolysing)/GDP/UDP-N,N'-diacetylbacillosamine 2-epimerase (hydrolysing)